MVIGFESGWYFLVPGHWHTYLLLSRVLTKIEGKFKNRLSRETGNSGHNAQNEDKEIKKYNTENQ
jgi:hypothetical protein